MTYGDAMKLPLKTFWMMSRNIDRIQARMDMRAFGTAAAAQSTPDYVASYQRRLDDEAGTVVKTKVESPLDAKRDEEGFGFLKRVSSETTG